MSLILRLALEASPQNQILSYKILQNMLKSNLVTEDVLEEAVRIASQFDGPVYDILATKRVLTFKNSRFLQLIFNQVLNSKEFLYRFSFDNTSRVSCAIAETLRTVKTIL